MTYVLVEKICVNEYVEHVMGNLGQNYQKPFLLSPLGYIIEELFGPVVPYDVSNYLTAGKDLDLQYPFFGHLFVNGKFCLGPLLLVSVSASIYLSPMYLAAWDTRPGVREQGSMRGGQGRQST